MDAQGLAQWVAADAGTRQVAPTPAAPGGELPPALP